MIDRKDFLTLFSQIERPLRAYLMATTGRFHEADDLAQNVWKVLWEKLDQYDERYTFQAWAMGVARMEGLKWRQRMARSREILSEEALVRLAETAVAQAEEINVRHTFLLDCLRLLEGFQRRAIDLKYFRRLNTRQIAEEVHKSEAAIEMTLVRVRRALRDCIEQKVQQAG